MSTKITVHNFEQRTEEWQAIRVGKIGGSNAVGVTTDARMKTLLYTVLSEIAVGSAEEIFTSNAMQYGIDTEPEAIARYEMEEMLKVASIGYITNSDYKYAGLSPDGVVGENGAVEVKCLLPKNHVKIIVENKVPTEYLPQLAWYFLINTDLEWIDFVSYCPKVTSKPYFKIRVLREDAQAMIDKVSVGYIKIEKKIDEALELLK